MLRPEKQDIVQFAAGVDAIVEAQARVARQYFEDGSVEAACPPLKALLHIMANGTYQGKGVEDAEVRGLFTREYLMESDWYGERLRTKQRATSRYGRATWVRSSDSRAGGDVLRGVDIDSRLAEACRQLARVSGHGYLKELTGTIGADPFFGMSQRMTNGDRPGGLSHAAKIEVLQISPEDLRGIT